MYAPEVFLRVVAVALMLGVAAWLLWLNRRSALHLTFAGFLVMRAMLVSAPLLSQEPVVASVAAFVVPSVQILISFLVPFFLYNFQKCHCIMHAHGASSEGLVLRFYMVAPILLAAVYLWRPDLYATDRIAALSSPIGAGIGPLYATRGLDLFAYALLGLLFQKEVADSPTPIHRYSYLSVSLGFALTAFFEGLAYPIHTFLTFAGRPPLDVALLLSLGFSLAAAAVATRVVLRFRHHLQASPDATVRSLTRPIRGLFAAALLSVLLLGAAAIVSITALQNANGILVPLWSLALPVLVTYAILRHHLFDIDLKFRLTIKRGLVAAVFVAVFFVASEGTQAFLQHKWGTAFGVAASAIVVLFLAPLQRRAERFAEAAVPIATSTASWSQPERATFYREQVHIAWGDGAMNAKERALLLNLREKLGLPAEEAEAIERQALNEHWLKRPEPEPAHPAN